MATSRSDNPQPQPLPAHLAQVVEQLERLERRGRLTSHSLSLLHPPKHPAAHPSYPPAPPSDAPPLEARPPTTLSRNDTLGPTLDSSWALSPCDYITSTPVLHELFGVVHDEYPPRKPERHGPDLCKPDPQNPHADNLDPDALETCKIGVHNNAPVSDNQPPHHQEQYRQGQYSQGQYRQVKHHQDNSTRQDKNLNSPWSPPLILLTALATNTRGPLLWIGEHCWPGIWSLYNSGNADKPGSLLGRSTFVRTPRSLRRDDERAARLWAAEICLRAGAVVITDGSGFDRADTQRLQLAARHGHRPCISVRPPRERAQLSAATTRWSLCPAHTENQDASVWKLKLLRLKGAPPAPCFQPDQEWMLLYEHLTQSPAIPLRFFPVVRCRFGAAHPAQGAGATPLANAIA